MAKVKGTNKRTRPKRSYSKPGSKRGRGVKQEAKAYLPIQVLQALYSKGLLPMDSRIISMKLGYSTLVQTRQTQVFAPTWEVRVRNAEGQVTEHFVNGIEGKVIDIQQSTVEIEDVE